MAPLPVLQLKPSEMTGISLISPKSPKGLWTAIAFQNFPASDRECGSDFLTPITIIKIKRGEKSR
jgi:hypothetical protein